MAAKIKNELGIITIQDEVIANLAGLAAMDCYGVVGMAAKDMRDGLVKLLKLDSLSRGIALHVNESGVSVDMHIIAEYGTNIPAIVESLVETVKYRLEETLAIPVNRVVVFVDDVRVNNN